MNDENKAEVARLARKGIGAEEIVARMNHMLTRTEERVSVEEVAEEICQLHNACGSELEAKVRKALEWSCNVGIAEDMAEETLRHNAQHIGGGIRRGEDQSLGDLVEDFKMRRTDADTKLEGDSITINDEWTPDDPQVEAALLELLDGAKGGSCS